MDIGKHAELRFLALVRPQWTNCEVQRRRECHGKYLANTLFWFIKRDPDSFAAILLLLSSPPWEILITCREKLNWDLQSRYKHFPQRDLNREARHSSRRFSVFLLIKRSSSSARGLFLELFMTFRLPCNLRRIMRPIPRLRAPIPLR